MTNDIGRLGLDSVDHYSGTNYPFVLPSVAREFVEDLQVTSELDDGTPLALVSITGVGQAAAVGYVAASSHAVDLQFGLPDGSIPIDTRTMSMSVTNWDVDTKIYTWQDQSTVVQAVINHSAAAPSAQQLFDGVLDDRAIVFLPPPVSDIQVFNRSTSSYESAIGNRQAKFKAGYNIAFDSQTTLSRGIQVQELVIDATPGSGEGRHPACPGNFGITEIGTVKPNSVGDILISGKDCIVVKPALTFSSAGAMVVPGQFRIYDSCKPRCEITDFTSAANYVTRQWNRFVALAKKFNDLRDKYHAIIGTYGDAYTCMTNNPIKGLVFSAQPNGIVVAINVFNPYCKTLESGTVKAKIVDTAGAAMGTLDPAGVFTTKYENGAALTVQTTATEADGEFSVQLYPIPGGVVSSTYIRLTLPASSAPPVGKATIAISGSLLLSFNDPQPVTFDFDLSQ